MRFIVSVDDAHDIQTHAASPVVREVLAHARRILNRRGQMVIQQVSSNAPAEIVRVISTHEELENWLGGAG